MSLSLIALTAATGLTAAHLLTTALAARHLEEAEAPLPGDLPPVTLLRPICGDDPLDEVTLESSFTQDHPDFRIIFCAPTETDPAVARVLRLMALYPQVRAQLLCGQEPRTGNPKLDNLWKGWHAARTDWVCMADANLLLPPDYLRQLAARWQNDAGKETGLVSSPAWGAIPEGMAARLEAAFLNGNQARLQLAADRLGLGFAQGKTLYWNRDMLNASGGLMALGRNLAEDVAATRLVRGQGLRVRLTSRPFAQPLGRRSFRNVWNRQLRWSRIRREGFPGLFLLEPLNGMALPLMLLLLAGAGPAALMGVIALWIGAEWALNRRAGWPAGPADLAAMLLRDLCLPLIWAATWASRDIQWRGTAMQPPANATTPIPLPEPHP